MVQGTIGKRDIGKLIAAVQRDGRFYGPAMEGGDIVLCELGPDDEVALGYANLKLPPKRFFFPQSEAICTFDEKSLTEAPLPEEKAVIFGVRPCDALALPLLDKIFLDGKFIDPYYKRRRDNTVVLSLACSDPLETCFCTSVGGSPTGRDGADVLAFDVGEVLLFEAVTEKGQAFMQAHAELFDEPGDKDKQARDALVSSTEGKLRVLDVSDIAGKLEEAFHSDLWDEIAQRCLSCTICTLLCPTCHCFGLYDEQVDPGGRRIRFQEACMCPGFTLEASGHNPRTTSGARMRQRVMHKFRYTVENFGDIFCVGCGRCVSYCPVNIDIRETILEVAK